MNAPGTDEAFVRLLPEGWLGDWIRAGPRIVRQDPVYPRCNLARGVSQSVLVDEAI